MNLNFVETAFRPFSFWPAPLQEEHFFCFSSLLCRMQQKSPRDRNLAMISVLLRRRCRRRRCWRRRRRMRSHQPRQCKVEPERTESFLDSTFFEYQALSSRT